MASRLTALRMLPPLGLAAVCCSPYFRAQAGDIDQRPGMRAVVWGIPDECLPGETLRLKVMTQNLAPDQQPVRLPEHVYILWAGRDDRGQWRRIHTPQECRLLDTSTHYGLYAPQEKRAAIRTLQVPTLKFFGPWKDDVALLVEAGSRRLEDVGDGKPIVAGERLEYAVPTQIAPYKVEKMWASSTLAHHKMIMEVGEVATGRSRYLVLGLRWINSNDRWPYLRRLMKFREGEQCIAVSKIHLSEDDTGVVVAWTCSRGGDGFACWQLLRNPGHLSFEYVSSGEVQLKEAPGRPELREDQGGLHLSVKQADGTPSLQMVLRSDVSVSTGPVDGDQAEDAAGEP